MVFHHWILSWGMAFPISSLVPRERQSGARSVKSRHRWQMWSGGCPTCCYNYFGRLDCIELVQQLCLDCDVDRFLVDYANVWNQNQEIPELTSTLTRRMIRNSLSSVNQTHVEFRHSGDRTMSSSEVRCPSFLPIVASRGSTVQFLIASLLPLSEFAMLNKEAWTKSSLSSKSFYLSLWGWLPQT